MKRSVLTILAVCIFISMFSTVSMAGESPKPKLRVVVNWKEIEFPDEKPYIDENSRTQTPARFIGEALGAEVSWDQVTQTAVFVRGDSKLELYIGKKEYRLNGELKQMDTEAILKNGRTFVPARYVAEAFGATVEWDARVRTAYITVPKVKEEKTGTEIRGGFVVPRDRKVTLLEHDMADIVIQLNVLMADYEGQINEMSEILSQKCDQTTVDQIVEYVKQKDDKRDHLAEKYIYDEKSQRYIWIEESQGMTINIYYTSSEGTKNYKKYIGE